MSNSLMYIMNIELQKGITKQLKVYPDSNSAEIAYYFCKENDLDFDSLNQLVAQIEKLQCKFTIQEEKEEEEKKSIEDKQKNKTIETKPSKKFISKEKTTIEKVDNNENKKCFRYQQLSKNHSKSRLKPKLFPNEIYSCTNSPRGLLSTVNNSKKYNRNRMLLSNKSTGNTMQNSYSSKQFGIHKPLSQISSQASSQMNIHSNNSKVNPKKSVVFNKLFKDAQMKQLFKRCLINRTNVSNLTNNSNISGHINLKEYNSKLPFDRKRLLIRSLSDEFIHFRERSKSGRNSQKKSHDGKEDIVLDNVRRAAFEKLFSDLCPYCDKLTKLSLNMKRVPKAIQDIIEDSITLKVRNGEKEYNKSSFILEMTVLFQTHFSLEERRCIISYYTKK